MPSESQDGKYTILPSLDGLDHGGFRPGRTSCWVHRDCRPRRRSILTNAGRAAVHCRLCHRLHTGDIHGRDGVAVCSQRQGLAVRGDCGSQRDPNTAGLGSGICDTPKPTLASLPGGRCGRIGLRRPVAALDRAADSSACEGKSCCLNLECGFGIPRRHGGGLRRHVGLHRPHAVLLITSLTRFDLTLRPRHRRSDAKPIAEETVHGP
jgi:hypothetical protein